MAKGVGTVIGLAIVGIGGYLLFKAKPVKAGGPYTCPYGDGLSFDTLALLQQHVGSAHPGERIPIDITWG